MAETDDDLDRLYGLALEEFTPARDRLADDLRAKGDREAAGRVKKLRKPSVSAWAVNQLVRKHVKNVQEVLAVGEEVRSGLAGGKAGEVRKISERRRRVIDRLLDLAEDLLNQAGHATTRPTLDKVGDTLMAATTDQEAADALRGGHLERELAPQSGFEALVGQMPVPTKAKSKQDQLARERSKRAENQAKEAEDAAKAAEREAARLEQEAKQTRQDAERARRRADRAAERAKELRQKAEELRPRRKV